MVRLKTREWPTDHMIASLFRGLGAIFLALGDFAEWAGEPDLRQWLIILVLATIYKIFFGWTPQIVWQ